MKYPFGTPGSKPRSIAYFDVLRDTGLFQPVPPPSGGLYLTSGLMWNVIVLPPLLITGWPGGQQWHRRAPCRSAGQPISGESAARSIM